MSSIATPFLTKCCCFAVPVSGPTLNLSHARSFRALSQSGFVLIDFCNYCGICYKLSTRKRYEKHIYERFFSFVNVRLDQN